MDHPEVRKLGEDIMIDKINNIFDEIARENDQFK